MNHRREVDGLRAIAVVPIVLFHAGYSGFDGGFVGVDIFFVISGYLITSIIVGERKSGNFSFADFYERRARRILPALVMVTVVTTLWAYAVLPANHLKDYSLSLSSVASFWSNIHFFLSGGYFSTAAEHKPLLHTWSLAIEEQYYFFFPVLLIALWRFGLPAVFLSIGSIAMLSLAAAQYLLSEQRMDANFFLLPSRAWELMFGSMLAFVSVPGMGLRRWLRDLLAGIGLLLIAYAVHWLDDDTPFPGVAGLLPVVGTCLVILFAAGDSRIAKLLSGRLLVGIGLASYSLYLWHQPLFAFLRLGTVGTPSPWAFALMIALTGFLAFLSLRYVERPFRDRQRFEQGTIFLVSGAALASLFGIGMAGYTGEGFAQRFSVEDYHSTTRFSPKRWACHTPGRVEADPSEACRYFGERVSWAVMGDSYAVELSYTMAQELEPLGQGVIHLSKSGCMPALTLDLENATCSRWTRDAISFLEASDEIEDVVMIYRFSVYLFGGHRRVYPELPNRNPAQLFAGEGKLLEADVARKMIWQSFGESVRRLMAAGKRVHVVYPVPELPLSIRRGALPRTVWGSEPILDLERAVSLEEYRRRNAFVLSQLDGLPYGDRLRAINPASLFCSGAHCRAVEDGEAIYADATHMSLSGARMLAEEILSPGTPVHPAAAPTQWVNVQVRQPSN